MAYDLFENLGFLDTHVTRIQTLSGSVEMTFSELDEACFQLRFFGVVFLEHFYLRRIEDWIVSDDSREIQNARDFLTRADCAELMDANKSLRQLTLLDDRSLPMLQIVFRDCQLVAGG
tara:strand:- start:74630 stop:74983 length:354 start_codon:yes stop_codon:yes gene_type:complete